MFLKFPLTDAELKKFKIPEKSMILAAADTMLNHLGMGDGQKKAQDVSVPCLELIINELSGALTVVGFNPNRDIEEDRQKLSVINRKQAEMVVAKMIVSMLNLLNLMYLERVIFFYHYPKFSRFC